MGRIEDLSLILDLVWYRDALRKEKRYKEADDVRNFLSQNFNVTLEDDINKTWVRENKSLIFCFR